MEKFSQEKSITDTLHHYNTLLKHYFYTKTRPLEANQRQKEIKTLQEIFEEEELRLQSGNFPEIGTTFYAILNWPSQTAEELNENYKELEQKIFFKQEELGITYGGKGLVSGGGYAIGLIKH